MSTTWGHTFDRVSGSTSHSALVDMVENRMCVSHRTCIAQLSFERSSGLDWIGLYGTERMDFVWILYGEREDLVRGRW